MTDNKSLTWRDVFDSYKLDITLDIYDVNNFIRKYTKYKFFSFNGTIYKAMKPKQFSEEEANTDLRVEGL